MDEISELLIAKKMLFFIFFLYIYYFSNS